MTEKEENNLITYEEKTELEQELKDLREVKRPEVIEQLKIARSFGDLSENAEYDSARKNQGEIESRIAEIENILRTSKVAEENTKRGTVTIGTSVEVETSDGEKRVYDIGTEGNGIEVSTHSPIAEGLMGSKVGEVVTISIPKGRVEMKIQRIM